MHRCCCMIVTLVYFNHILFAIAGLVIYRFVKYSITGVYVRLLCHKMIVNVKIPKHNVNCIAYNSRGKTLECY